MATIRKRKNTYQIRVSCGYDSTGKQIVQTHTWKPDQNMTTKQIEKELQRQAVLFEEACIKGQITSSVKFETFAEQWFEEYAKINLRNTTYERLLQLRNRIYPALGHYRMDKLTARHIQIFINCLSQNGANEKTGNPLAPKTIRHHLSFISDIFSYAIKMGMITDNPCQRVFVPKNEQKEKMVYTINEVEQFFRLLKAAPMKYRTFFTLIIYSGFRRSEMLGLEWKDIDFENCIISIKRTSNYTAEKGTYTDTTKTKRSQRSLKLPSIVMRMLKDYQIEQNAEIKRLGNKWIHTDRLFVKWNGEPMNNNTPYFWLNEFCEKYNFPFYGIHSFRHLNASLLINAGIDITSVSGALGHAQTSTTLNIYSHMFQEAKAKTCDAVANALDFSKDH